MIAGIETGGTKVICAVAATGALGTIVDRLRIPTTSPAETLGAVRTFLERYASAGELDAVGLAAFGPVTWIGPRHLRVGDLHSQGGLAQHRHTPRPGPGGLHAAASGVRCDRLGRWGAALGGRDRPADLQRSHPEMGHLPVRRYPGDDFPGSCPFHASSEAAC